MPKQVGATIAISKEVSDLADRTQRSVITKIGPRAIAKAVPIIRAAIIAELPDGDVGLGNKPPSRSLQSAKSRQRYPYKMKKQVRVKSINNDRQVMKIVGVDRKGAHVNFDHGQKAMTVGREHKLWWIDGVREKHATPKFRKQQRDIPKIVHAKVGMQAAKAVEDEFVRAVNAGEL